MLHILVNAVNQSSFYKAGSLKITSQSGNEKSSFSFSLVNPDTAPSEEQEVIIYNQSTMTTKETAGRIRRVSRILESIDPTDNSPVFTYDIEVSHWARSLDRRPAVSKSYAAGTTTGFIFRDLAVLVPGLTLGNVTSGGQAQPSFELRQERISRGLDRLSEIEGWQWWIDDDKVFHFEDPVNTPAPFELTTSTYADIAGKTLRVEPDTDNLANYITMNYKGKYSTGTVNTSTVNPTVITGNGTKWLNNVKPGAKIRMLNYPSVSYTIERIVSDTNLEISSDFKEGQLNTLSYIIEDIPLSTTMVDAPSVEAMKAITGDDGVFADQIDGPATYLTYTEAREYLRGVLNQRAWPAVNINFKSTSAQITGKVQAGQSVVVNLPAWGLTDKLYQIKQVRKEDAKALHDNGDPVWKYDITIETKLYTLPSKFRKIDEILRGKGSDSVTLYDYLPIIAELVDVTDSVVINSDVGWAPFVWGPSTFTWTSQADWNTWTHTNTQATVGNSLTLSGVNLSGSAISPWQIQYSPNSFKTPTYGVNLPAGATIVFEYRTADDQGSPGPWVASYAAAADAKYIQHRITLTRLNSGDDVRVDDYMYQPYKSVLRWGESYWMGVKDTWDSQAEWGTWTFSNCNNTDTPGAVVLTAGQNSGTATSPWTANYTRTVAKVMTPTVSTPGVSTITYEYRTSPDGTNATASAWVADHKATPDYPYIQIKATLTGTVGDRPQLQKFEIDPK